MRIVVANNISLRRIETFPDILLCSDIVCDSITTRRHSILIKRTDHPDYMSHGVPVSSLIDSFQLNIKVVSFQYCIVVVECTQHCTVYSTYIPYGYTS